MRRIGENQFDELYLRKQMASFEIGFVGIVAIAP